jgi:ABC-type multidrug transport system fused ATPase/permease subunit
MDHNDSAVSVQGRLLTPFIKWVFLIVTIVVIGALVAYISQFGSLPFGDNNAFGTFGDYIGGIINPLFGFATIILLIRSLNLQLEELQLTRKEIADTKTVAQESNRIIQQQAKSQLAQIASDEGHRRFAKVSYYDELYEKNELELEQLFEQRLSIDNAREGSMSRNEIINRILAFDCKDIAKTERLRTQNNAKLEAGRIELLFCFEALGSLITVVLTYADDHQHVLVRALSFILIVEKMLMLGVVKVEAADNLHRQMEQVINNNNKIGATGLKELKAKIAIVKSLYRAAYLEYSKNLPAHL